MTDKNPNLRGQIRALSFDQEVALIADYEAGTYTLSELSVTYKVSRRTITRTMARYKVPKPEKERKERPRRELLPCGTTAAYQRHLHNGELPCIPCADASAAEAKSRYIKTRVYKPCGTNAAWTRHVRNGEKPCKDCIEAHKAYNRETSKRYRRNHGARNSN